MAKKHIAKRLTELPATAICGNDISSSCLYVSALSIFWAGQYAWIALLIVAVVLFLFRGIYGEVVGALPLNGGAYNALLNTTSKRVASLAACLTLLSYMATAVISATEGMHYMHHLWHGLDIPTFTIGLLTVFMFLTLLGIGESAMVAVIIFITHLAALVLLIFAVAFWIFNNGFDVLSANWAMEIPAGPPGEEPLLNHKFIFALFFGFSAAMLGISGFESSSNFVEEQAPGVFPKTLRNMWIVVSILNPLLAFLAISIFPIELIQSEALQSGLLAKMGVEAAGPWLGYIISIDALLVLSGAVLTSFVGVGGLVQRMTLDRIMPQFLLKLNKRGSPYWIMMLFFVLCVSIFAVTWWTTENPMQEQVPYLAGIYTISFLAVMALFAFGNILLKVKRAKLPRPERASALAIFIAIVAVIGAMAGQIIMHPDYFFTFLTYFLPTLGIVGFMLYRIPILGGILYVLRYFSLNVQRIVNRSNKSINNFIEQIKSQEFVFFTKGDNVATLNRVMQYIEDNENTKKIRIVTVLPEEAQVPPGLLSDIEVLDRTYPDIKIDFITLNGIFGPELIEKLSEDWNIPKNFMFIGSPGDRFPYRIEELGGVRLII